MPRLSPNGRSILSGVGSSRIRIDGVIPPGLEHLTAGDWAWRDNNRIVGQGSDGGDSWYLRQYTLSTAVLETLDARPASATYGGGGEWAVFVAANPFYSYDAYTTWSDRVAKGVSPTGTKIFTSHENDTLYWNGQMRAGKFDSLQIGVLDVILWWDGSQFQAINIMPPLAPLSGGFNARFTSGGWMVQWNAGLNALVVYQMQTARPVRGYVLSTDEKDFNHDIALRDDGMVVVATAIDQGETATRLYELDIVNYQWRVNGGLWQPLMAVSMDETVVPPIEPIDPIDPIDPPDPEPPMIPLPAKCYVLLHNSNIAAVVPGQVTLELAWPAQEYGPYQEVEITASHNPHKVLVRFTGANRLFRVDTVLAQQQQYEAAISQTWDPNAPDADSGWQNGVPSGPFIHFLGPDVSGRTGIVYTLTCVDGAGKLFR